MRIVRTLTFVLGVASLTGALVHCGLLASEPSAPTSEGGPEDSGSLAALIADAGVCASPTGIAVCGGPYHCFPDGGALCDDCSLAISDMFTDAYSLGLCISPDLSGTPGLCSDDCVYVQLLDPRVLSHLPFEVGPLFAANGGGGRLRYADFSAWTGDALPPIPSCTIPGGAQGCGGSCAACAPDRTCTGRSPLHPIGLCVPTTGHGCSSKEACPGGQACFAWQTEPDAQADVNSYYAVCLPTKECESAAKMPGGGYCTNPQM